jgi:hypothetical protein
MPRRRRGGSGKVLRWTPDYDAGYSVGMFANKEAAQQARRKALGIDTRGIGPKELWVGRRLHDNDAREKMDTEESQSGSAAPGVRSRKEDLHCSMPVASAMIKGIGASPTEEEGARGRGVDRPLQPAPPLPHLPTPTTLEAVDTSHAPVPLAHWKL